MKKIIASFSFILLLCLSAGAIDLGGLDSIGSVSGYTRSQSAITLNCRDNSQVRITVLAPDLVRVRASFKKPLPERDHSWAIARTTWDSVPWQVREEEAFIIISTGELEVAVRRAPLLIEFRDARTRRVINADARPMMFDPKGTTVASAKRFGFDEHFYGLGEKAARLDKRRGHFTMWNSDTPGYTEGTDPIYQSIPFYIGWERGECYGIFFDNSYRTHFDLGRSSQEHMAFSADGGEMNYYFFWGPSMKKIIGRYSELTGHMPMPPKWALGNQQSRWGYYPQAVAEAVVDRYRKDDLPLDVLHLDIDYMNEYRVFTWNTSRFPDPRAFTERLERKGVKVVTIVDPGIKHQKPEKSASDATLNPELAPQDKSYYVFNQGIEKDFFMKRKDGKLYIPKVWPGDSVFVDYTLEPASRWWGDLHRSYTDHGVDGIWTDMNEPSDFTDQTGKAQMDVVSYDGGENSTHAKNRNVFALLMARATYEGLERLEPRKRPYVITRAGYAGIQRYSTMWTGDNNSTWDALALSIPMFQTLGLGGQPFVGGDVGGFIGRSDGEMLTRWYQVGFLTPFLRNHKVIDGYDHEPWRFGKYYEDIIRQYLKLRYRLMPFIYTTLEEAHRTGVPVFRPLLLNYQHDTNTLNLDDQFMVGADLLVAPVVKPGQSSRRVYLPEGVWVDYWTGRRHAGAGMIEATAPLERVPLFIRAGAIIPTGPAMNFTGEKPVDPLTFEIYPDDKGQSAATLYEDDGTSNDYRQGVFRRTAVKTIRAGSGIQIELDAPEGNYDPGPRSIVFTIKQPLTFRQVTLDNRPLAPARSDEKKAGWYRIGNDLAVRIPDDGKAHRIQIR